MTIDINCDVGEGMPNDEALMPYISSANIACGAHAGDPLTIARTIELCLHYGVAIGAHPSFDDRANFGRTECLLTEEELYNLIYTQLFSFQQITNEMNATLHHVKPHGALYNMAARDASIAAVISQAVKDIDGGLILFGLSGSCSIAEAKKSGLKSASEVFADRTYLNNGKLTPRSEPDALITNEQQSMNQVLQMIQKQKVTSVTGAEVAINAETICIHGDGPLAVEFAKKIKETLLINGISIKPI